MWAQSCVGTNVSEHKFVRAQSCVGTNVCGHNRVWAQTSVGTNVSGHNRVWAQSCVGTIVSGHKRVWAQSCLGTIVSGHNRVWAQSCVVTIVCERKRVWAQSCLGTIVCGHNRVGSIMYGPNRGGTEAYMGNSKKLCMILILTLTPTVFSQCARLGFVMIRKEALYSIDNYTSFYNNFRTSIEVWELLYTSLRGLHSRICLAGAIWRIIWRVSLWSSVRIDSVSYVVGRIYRPPNSDAVIFLLEMESILVYLPTNYSRSQIILSSDFNIDLMHLNDRNVSNSLLPINESFNLYPLALRPTRVSATSATLIDNIFTNNYNRLNVCCIVCALISDHFAVFAV